MEVDLLSTRVYELFNCNSMEKTPSSDSDISPLSMKNEPILFLNIEKLLQTDTGFGVGECDAMMQLFIFIIAMFIHNDYPNIKGFFIEPIMDFDEDF